VRVRDSPGDPDPGFAELYASLPDATDLEPWLAWCEAAGGPVLYLGVGAGRLAVPLAAAGVELVGVDAHPGMIGHLCARLAGAELHLTRIERLDLGRRFPLVIGPSSILASPACLAGAARHAADRVALELMNPHWLLGGEHPTVRIRRATRRRAEIEVDYPGGWTHVAKVALRWPEEVEDHLAAAGLALELIRGQDPDGDVEDSPTYYVLAHRRGIAGRPRLAAGRAGRPG
jgi:hypothetical protein